jgi:hypothetical protein
VLITTTNGKAPGLVHEGEENGLVRCSAAYDHVRFRGCDFSNLEGEEKMRNIILLTVAPLLVSAVATLTGEAWAVTPEKCWHDCEAYRPCLQICGPKPRLRGPTTMQKGDDGGGSTGPTGIAKPPPAATGTMQKQ